MLIFKRGPNNPFALGPSPKFIGIEVDHLKGPYDLGKGFVGYLATSPDGKKTALVEATTGAIVGPTVEKVRADIEACPDIQIMQDQVDQARGWLSQVQKVSEEVFWGR